MDKHGKRLPLTEWIFPHSWKLEQSTHPSAAYKRMKVLLKEAEPPDLRFHDLRHTFATLALQNGVDIKTASRMPGHFSAGFTLDTCAHVTSVAQRQAAQTMGNVLAGTVQT